MSPKGMILSLSLAGSAAGFACWLLAARPGENTETDVRVPARVLRTAPGRTVEKFASQSTSARAKESPGATTARSPAGSRVRQQQSAVQRLTSEELASRAARVEQEANHDLRRLVRLLDLSEEQQDKVFETLARHSPSWTAEMQIAASAPDISASTTGKRSEALTLTPGNYPAPVVGDIPEPSKTPVPPATPVAGEITAPVKAPDVPGEDPMDEIMALLNPEQQDTLAQEELDRIAWWAEILEQITPPDDVPALDGSPPVPAPGGTQTYEGADVLE